MTDIFSLVCSGTFICLLVVKLEEKIITLENDAHSKNGD